MRKNIGYVNRWYQFGFNDFSMVSVKQLVAIASLLEVSKIQKR